ncbi:MAG: hypothetical protein E6J62_09980 [Deltaproteobacteria bacterium]|nr:MAG: hypothetical protein E6J62_09980 [Deltaproteobacteria bacterium]
MRSFSFVGGVLLATILGAGCGHTLAQQHVGLASVGDLFARVLTPAIDGPILEGHDCGTTQYLSKAVRDALKDTAYDTLLDLEVTTETGLFGSSNCLKVKGKAIDSKKLPVAATT